MSSLKGDNMNKTENAEVVSAIFGASPLDGHRSFHDKVSVTLSAIQTAMDSPDGQALFARYKADELTRDEYREAIVALIPGKEAGK